MNSTATDSPVSSPAPGPGADAASSPTWNYATAAKPAARTIRTAKDTGLRNLPLHHFAQNQIRCQLVALTYDLPAWMQMLALQGSPARRYEPKRLRLRLFTVDGRLARGSRRLRLRIAARWPWVQQIITTVARPQALPAPT